MRLNMNVRPFVNHNRKFLIFEAFLKILFEAPGDNLLKKTYDFLLNRIVTLFIIIVAFVR